MDNLSNTFIYIDDVLVERTDKDTYKQHLKDLFRHFSLFGKVVNPEKCEFRVHSLIFLGHTITTTSITFDESTINVIQKFPLTKMLTPVTMISWHDEFL